MVKIYRMSINGLPHDPMSRSALISFVSTYRKKKLYSLSNALSELKALKENGSICVEDY